MCLTGCMDATDTLPDDPALLKQLLMQERLQAHRGDRGP